MFSEAHTRPPVPGCSPDCRPLQSPLHGERSGANSGSAPQVPQALGGQPQREAGFGWNPMGRKCAHHCWTHPGSSALQQLWWAGSPKWEQNLDTKPSWKPASAEWAGQDTRHHFLSPLLVSIQTPCRQGAEHLGQPPSLFLARMRAILCPMSSVGEGPPRGACPWSASPSYPSGLGLSFPK